MQNAADYKTSYIHTYALAPHRPTTRFNAQLQT